MKHLILILCLISVSIAGHSQTHPYSTKQKADVIFIVKLIHPDKEIITKNLYVGKDDFDIVEMLGKSQIVARHSSIKNDVALVVKPKSYVNLSTLDQFYNIHNIEKQYRGSIRIGDKPITDTTNFLIYDKAVKSVLKKGNGINIILKDM